METTSANTYYAGNDDSGTFLIEKGWFQSKIKNPDKGILSRSFSGIKSKIETVTNSKSSLDDSSIQYRNAIPTHITALPPCGSQVDLRNYLERPNHETGFKRKFNSNNSMFVKRRRYTLDSTSLAPLYRNYQLLGDSQLVRFSEQLLGYRDCITYTVETKSRRIGYCVSGQKIKDLKKRLKHQEYNIHTNVIMLIGTNDLLYNTGYSDMCKYYDKILKILKKTCNKLVLLTVPPVPRQENYAKHWIILKNFNKFIHEKADNNLIFVVDLCSLFLSYDNSISRNYFESVFHTGPRPDLVHLNTKGFKLLRSVLDIHYFDEQNEPLTITHGEF